VAGGFVGVTVGRAVVFSTSVGADGGVGLFAAVGVADGLGLSSITGKACGLDW
jgi:hypothetical protein